jgi:hypothetical protein
MTQPHFHSEYARGTTCSTGGECAMWRIFASLFWPAGKEASGRFFVTLVLGGVRWLATATRITGAWQSLR